MNAAHQFQAGLDSATRILANAETGKRWAVFQTVIAPEVGTFVRKGFNQQDAVDFLQDLAVSFNLTDEVGEDAVTAAMANGLSGDDAKANGQAPRASAENGAGAETASLDPLPFLDMSGWDDEPAPPRLWAVQDRIPLRQPTLFSGEGAIGKTLLALQLSAAHVLQRDWLGMLPEPGPAIYFGAEDDGDEYAAALATSPHTTGPLSRL